MAWIVGIDEAGYGPNLGPFVMSSVACRVPDALADADLWKVLKSVVCRRPNSKQGRIFIEDSKKVYSPSRGLGDLERGVWAALSPWRDGRDVCLHDWLTWISSATSMGDEPWYGGDSRLPLENEGPALAESADRFHRCCAKNEASWGLVRSAVIGPRRFNGLLDQWDSKGAVLGQALHELLTANRDPDDGDEPVRVFVDKHGGRNCYAAMLQQAFPDGYVAAREEGMERSAYTVHGLKRRVDIVFSPRADASHFCVALASMCSKYLRELLMVEFNRYWQSHLPDLKPTAGYPGDAERFYQSIRPLLQKLAIEETAIWRRK